MVDLGRDPPDDTTVAAGEEVLGVAVLEERVEAPVEEQIPLELQWWDPGRSGVQGKRQRHERAQIARALDPADRYGHRRGTVSAPRIGLTVRAQAAAWAACSSESSSASVNSSSVAPRFSSKCSIEPVPGIGTITGECPSSQASAT